MAAADELAEIFPPPSPQLTVGGQTITLAPLTLRELPAALAALQASKMLGSWDGDTLRIDYADAFLGPGREAFVDLMSQLGRVEREAVEGWTPDEAKRAFDALVTLNIDFFVLAVGRLAASPAAPAAGSPPSSGSAAPATD